PSVHSVLSLHDALPISCVQTDDFSPSQIGERTTRMSAAITFSKISGHSSRSQPCSVMSGYTPVAIWWSTARMTSTETPLRSMIRSEEHTSELQSRSDLV